MQSKKPPTKSQAAFVGLLAVAFIGVGAFDLPETLAVIRSESIATAQVVESRAMPTRWGMSYDLRYRFSPVPGASEVGRKDFLGRSDLWASLPEQDWKVAVATQQLQVRFDPRNPTNNAPAVLLPSIWDSITPLVMGVILAVIAIGSECMRRSER